ncbi:MAG: hypothetical protein AB7Q23_04270 [Hyphomonadaceae bacterium]
MTDPHRAKTESPPRAPQVAAKTLKYKESQEHLLRRIAAGIVLHWDELPDALQDLIIDQAAAVEDRDPSPHTAEDIAAFIRGVKTAALSKTGAEGSNSPS